MKILLDGTFGTGIGSRGFLIVAAGLGPETNPDCLDSGREEAPPPPPAAAIAREATSGLMGFMGGGYGERETLVTEAECAW